MREQEVKTQKEYLHLRRWVHFNIYTIIVRLERLARQGGVDF